MRSVSTTRQALHEVRLGSMPTSMGNRPEAMATGGEAQVTVGCEDLQQAPEEHQGMVKDQTPTAALRDVVKIRELRGPRGGTKYVMELSCGCLAWQNRPRQQVRCIPCWWKEEELSEYYAQLAADEKEKAADDDRLKKWLIKREEPTAGYSEIYFYPVPVLGTTAATMNHLWPWYLSMYSVTEVHDELRKRGDYRFLVLRGGARVDSCRSMADALKLLSRVASHE